MAEGKVSKIHLMILLRVFLICHFHAFLDSVADLITR